MRFENPELESCRAGWHNFLCITVSYFSDSTKDDYRAIFLGLSPKKRIQLAQELGEIHLSKEWGEQV